MQQDIRRIQLDLLETFINVCSRHHLRYFPCGGTLLGCIRHQGFIPWDDDIDIDMPREDYEKLKEIAPSEFSFPYFFQTSQSDPEYFSGHAKLRNSTTTGIIKEDIYFNYNKGIFIDIFPLDHIPDKPLAAEVFCMFLYCFRNVIILGSPAYHAFPHRITGKLLRLPCFLIVKLLRIQRLSKIYEKLCCFFQNKKNSSRIAPVSVFPLRKSVRWNPILFHETQNAPFESLQIQIPAAYDSILRQQFGDYKSPRKEPSQHSTVYLDPYTPYTAFHDSFYSKYK